MPLNHLQPCPIWNSKFGVKCFPSWSECGCSSGNKSPFCDALSRSERAFAVFYKMLLFKERQPFWDCVQHVLMGFLMRWYRVTVQSQPLRGSWTDVVFVVGPGGCLASCGEQLFTHQQLCSQITSGLHLNYCTFVNMHFLSLVLSNGNIAGQIIPSEPLKWSPVMWPVSMCCWKEKNTLGNFTSYPWRSSRWKENRLERLTSVRSLASQLLSVQRAVVNSWVSHYL